MDTVKHTFEVNILVVSQIVIHSACDYLRRRKKHTKPHDRHYPVYTDGENSPEDQYLRREMKETLKACLERLAPKERIVFLLR